MSVAGEVGQRTLDGVRQGCQRVIGRGTAETRCGVPGGQPFIQPLLLLSW